MSREIRLLMMTDVRLLNALLTTFGAAFDDESTYTERRPSDAYLQKLLAGDAFIALAALEKGAVVGGIAAYELVKYEQERSEIYLYDLAVAETHRRTGIATALIAELKKVALDRGASGIFVQADTGVEDQPAIQLYSKLGTRAEVLHFDISLGRDAAAK